MIDLISSKNLQKFNISFFISLIIPFLIWGPFVPDLIVSVFSLIFLYHVIKNKNFYYFNNKPLIIFFIFCFYCILVSLFIATDILLSLESSLFYFRIGIFSCFIWYLVEKDINFLNSLYYIIVICFSILIIDGFFEYFNRSNLLGYKSIHPIRISSFFRDELILGSYLSRIFPLLFALFIIKKKKSKYETYYVGLLFILADVLIFISGERTAFFFLNLSTIFIIILIKDFQKFRLVTFIVSLIIVMILVANNEKIFKRMISGPLNTMGLSELATEKKIFTPGHDSLFRTAYNMFLDRPLFGHGPKMFRLICNDEKYKTGLKPCDTHPHNFYIQLLAETGIVGFLYLISVFFYVLYSTFKQLLSILLKKKRYLTDYQVCLLAGILITVWPFSPNGNFFNNWLMIVYSLPVGLYLQSIYSRKKN